MNKQNIPDFANPTIKAYDQMIYHYEMVLKDLSGVIYDPKLEAEKELVIEFLNQIKAQWQTCKTEFINQFYNR